MTNSHIYTELSEHQQQRLDWFERNYNLVDSRHFDSSSSKTYLGARADRICRYCGKKAPEVAFRNTAHAFPEHIGNKWLIDRNECDDCNDHFARLVEDDFSKWTLPQRSTGMVSGKKLPSIVSTDKAFRIEPQNAHNLLVSIKEENDRYLLDEANGVFDFEVERQPYIPMGAFKCMAKMAVAAMPPEDDLHCGKLKSWLLQKHHAFDSQAYGPLSILKQSITGPFPNNYLSYHLVRRRTDAESNCPHMQFILCFSNLILQIALPMQEADDFLCKAGKYEMSHWWHAWDTPQRVEKYGHSIRSVVDMSSEVAVRDSCKMRMHFEVDADTNATHSAK